MATTRAGHPSTSPGFAIKKCKVPGTVAIGFDDGPWFYTEYVLDELRRFNAHATFFVQPAPRIIDTHEAYWAPVIRRMRAEGHQVALHGYAHEHFDALEPAERLGVLSRAAAFWSRPGFLDGLAPTYMRPPWGECDDGDDPRGCLAGLTAAGYRVVFWDTDPRDWENDSEFEIHKSIDLINSALSPENAKPATDSFLLVAHDIHLQTAINLTQAVLQTVEKRGFRAVTIGECVGEPQDLWYKSVSTGPPPFPRIVSLPAMPDVWAGPTVTIWTFAVLALMALSAVWWALRTYTSLRRKQQSKWSDLSIRKE